MERIILINEEMEMRRTDEIGLEMKRTDLKGGDIYE